MVRDSQFSLSACLDCTSQTQRFASSPFDSMPLPRSPRILQACFSSLDADVHPARILLHPFLPLLHRYRISTSLLPVTALSLPLAFSSSHKKCNNTNPVVVNDLGNDGELAGRGAVVDENDTADLDETLEHGGLLGLWVY